MVKVDKHIKQAIRDKYAWPGGYPVNWEDNELYCDHCNKQIEAAYSGE